VTLTLNDIVAIVQSEEAREIKDAVIYTILMLSVAIPTAVYLYKRFMRVGVIFSFFALCSCCLMATKPQITWDTGLSNNGSFFNTNTWKQVFFRWFKLPTIAATEPVYFAAKHKDYPELEYTEIGQSVAGLGAWDYTFVGNENATNYNYYAYTIGEVHTNGVWLGNILQKVTPGSGGPDKMVIIKSLLEVDGKQIAPFKEN